MDGSTYDMVYSVWKYIEQRNQLSHACANFQMGL